MSSQEESDAMLEAKLATMIEPFKKVGINTNDCTLKGLPIASCSIVVEQFGKIQKFLHHLVRQEIFPQLMAQAFVKGIISSTSNLTAADIWNINTWLRTKEGQTSIQDEFKIRKSKRKAAKLLNKEIISSSTGTEIMERMVNELKIRKSKRKAAKLLNKEMSSSSGTEIMERMVNEQFRKMEERADAQDKALADLRKELQDHRNEIQGFLNDFRRDHQLVPAMVQSIDSRLTQQSQQIQDMTLAMESIQEGFY